MSDKLYDMIFKRKSFHLFRNVGDEMITEQEINDIYSAWESFKPLFADIKTAIKIVPEKDTTCRRGGEYSILIYSEKKDGYLANAGYLGEMLDLYLASINIGALWFGIGKAKEKEYQGLQYVIMFAVRKISDLSKFRKDMFKSKRKSLSEIWEGNTINGVSDIVRFAPSACNSQPWRVVNDGNLTVYRYRKKGRIGIMPASMVSYFNRIDIGIFLCFLELCLEKNGVKFEKQLFFDDGGDNELTINAKYSLIK